MSAGRCIIAVDKGTNALNKRRTVLSERVMNTTCLVFTFLLRWHYREEQPAIEECNKLIVKYFSLFLHIHTCSYNGILESLTSSLDNNLCNVQRASFHAGLPNPMKELRVVLFKALCFEASSGPVKR